MSVNQTCFTRETLVATENGQIQIDEIKAGDKVGAIDEPLEYARLALDGEMQMWVDAEDSLELW